MNFSTTDQSTILDSNSAGSVSAAIAAANLLSTLSSDKTFAEKTTRFPGEDGGHSLAEIAQKDLDAALQLLADRAQYITGASGAAIALRRGEHADMLCRASAGMNAPELGSLLSMEYGLSGESVRTARSLRCDDAERDPRVNRECCRRLGIASVLIMPILSDRQVLGVFELFSGKPHAFDERDVSALQRLSEMVETAVKHAIAAQAPAIGFTSHLPVAREEKRRVVIAAVPQAKSRAHAAAAASALGPSKDIAPEKREVLPSAKSRVEAKAVETESKVEADSKVEIENKKPLFWSAAMRAQSSSQASERTLEPVTVPPALRKMPKCGACGFPVSPGRIFCVECEEKQWRGQPFPQRDVQASKAPEGTQITLAASVAPDPAVVSSISTAIPSPADAVVGESTTGPFPIADASVRHLSSAPIAAQPLATQASKESSSLIATDSAGKDQTDQTNPDQPALFLNAVVQPQSWLAANRYVLGTLMLVALVIGAIAWLR
jgi:hypothetical protein